MTMTKNKGLYFGIILIILGVLNVIAWTIPFPKEGNFWTGYSFAMFAIFLTAGVIFYTFDRETLKSRFYHIPLIMVAWRYLFIQLIFAIIQMGLSFLDIPFQIGLVLNTIMLGFCIIGLFTVEMAKDEIIRIDQKIKEQTFFVKSLAVDVENIVGRVTDDLKKTLQDLAETIRYSDPMSSPQLATIENKIEVKIAGLSEAVEGGDNEAIKKLCEELQIFFAERNRKCKALK